ncbi:MAG: acyl carrier protein [Leptolyngbya sp. PLA3]|nr:MAG: acyl carrier protein [Cyanobacteria bacterium CYA]MCE7969827.1 acyl carrier protein [Leptolyngbya sp. PL-A3]
MNQDQIFEKVQGVLVEALAVDEDEVTPQATLFAELGAESIDVLDISFQLERAFDIKINQGELFPEGVTQDPEYVQNGKLTDKGLSTLKARLPHFDLSPLEADRSVQSVVQLFTVQSLVNFVEQKLAEKKA